MFKLIMWFVALCLIGLLLPYKAYNIAETACIDASKGQEQRARKQVGGDHQNKSANQIVPKSGESKPDARNQKTPADEEDQTPWPRRFWCNVSMSDYAIIYLTYCLVVAGVFAALLAQKAIRESERAYVFPGMHYYQTTVGTIRVSMGQRNFPA